MHVVRTCLELHVSRDVRRYDAGRGFTVVGMISCHPITLEFSRVDVLKCQVEFWPAPYLWAASVGIRAQSWTFQNGGKLKDQQFLKLKFCKEMCWSVELKASEVQVIS